MIQGYRILLKSVTCLSKIPLTVYIFLALPFSVKSQYYNIDKGCLTDNLFCACNSSDLIRSSPFVRKLSDAHSGGLGNAGIVTKTTGNAMQFNFSKVMFSKSQGAVAFDLAPMFFSLGIDDRMLYSISTFTHINKKYAIGMYFKGQSMGKGLHQTTTFSGQSIAGEHLYSIALARKWNNSLSSSISLKYIQSNIAFSALNFSDPSIQLTAGKAVSTDIAFTYDKTIEIENINYGISLGVSISDLGTFISYSNDLVREYLPANLGVGVSVSSNKDLKNVLITYFDINILLVPSRSSMTHITGGNLTNPILAGARSFTDAEGGLVEEYTEIYYAMGIEYILNKKSNFTFGYLYEHPNKGNRKALTFGIGRKIKRMEFDFSRQFFLGSNTNYEIRY